MNNEPITHDKPFPVEASGRPDNAYYLRHCHAIERGPAYASCLSRLHDIDKGVVNERTNECAKTAREGRCLAAGMREQENLAGQALYYFPRLNKPFVPVQAAGQFGVLITNLTDPALIPKPAPTFGLKKPTPPAPSKLEAQLEVNPLAVAITNAVQMHEPVFKAAEQFVAPPAEKTYTVVVGQAKAEAPITQEQLRQELIKNPIQVELPPTVAPASSTPKLLPGETPLQFARRMAALRNAPKT